MAETAQHTEPYMSNLVHAADGVLIVVDAAADDLAAAAPALLSLLERARVWPASRPLPSGAPPFAIQRPVPIEANKCDLDPDDTLASRAREALGEDLPFFGVSAEHGAGLEDLRRA